MKNWLNKTFKNYSIWDFAVVIGIFLILLNYLGNLIVSYIYYLFSQPIFGMYSSYIYTNQYSFTEPATSLMVGIIDLHHSIFFYLIVIFVLINFLLFSIIFFTKKKMFGYIKNKRL